MKPTIGRIVIYNIPEDGIRMFKLQGYHRIKNKVPAIIVSVNDDETVDLSMFVIGPTASFYGNDVKQGDGEGEWNWPVIEK